MSKRIRCIFSITVVLFCSFSKTSSANYPIDSLKMIVENSVKDSSLVHNYLLIAEQQFENSLKESKLYANKALHVSIQLTYAKGKSKSLLILGKIEHRQGKLHIALNHIKQGLIIFEQQNNLHGKAKSHEELGKLYSKIGDMAKAMLNHQQALRYFQELSNEKGIADCFRDIGHTHFLQHNYSTSLRYYKKAKTIYLKKHFQKELAELYNLISLVYREINELNKSLEYDYMALMTHEQLRHKKGVANSNYNIGKTSILQREIKRAKGYIDYAEKLYQELDDNIGIINCCILSAKIDIKEKKYLSANNTLKKGIKIAERIGAVKQLAESYFLLSDISAKAKDFESAYRYLNRHTVITDSISKFEINRRYRELGSKYKGSTEKKDTPTSEQTKELSQGLTTLIIGVSGIAVLLLLYLIYAIRKKTKAVKEASSAMEYSSDLVRKRNKEIIDSISYAKKIQDAILTPDKYLSNIFTEHFVYYQPKDIVSGDFYWAYKDTASNKIFWVTADCTGHGVPGALMSVIGTVILNEIVIVRRQHSPDKILNSLSKYLKRYLNKDKSDISQDGIELSLCVLDHDNQEICFCGANRNLYHIRAGQLTELKGDKQPIGFDPFDRDHQPFNVHRLDFKKGDQLYAFTDGYTDQIGGYNNKKYRVGVLKQDLLDNHEKSMIEQKISIQANIKNWMKNYSQLDDILVIGVKI